MHYALVDNNVIVTRRTQGCACQTGYAIALRDNGKYAVARVYRDLSESQDWSITKARGSYARLANARRAWLETVNESN